MGEEIGLLDVVSQMRLELCVVMMNDQRAVVLKTGNL